MPDSTTFPTGDAIARIQDLCNRANGVDVIRVDTDPIGVFRLYQRSTGQLTIHESDRSPLSIDLEDPNALIDFLKNPPPGIDLEAAAAYVGADRVELRLTHEYTDNRAGSDYAIVQLLRSPQLGSLVEKSKVWFSQRDFVRFLRIELAGTLPADSTLLAIVKNLRFSATSANNATIQHGRESMGRSIETEVFGESTFPEEVTLNVPIWSNWPTIERIRCALEIDSAAQTFKLTPFPMALTDAIADAVAKLCETLTNVGVVPVYRGSV